MHRLEKTRAFLTEFIIVILFFTISAVITVQLFAAANRKSADSISITDGYLKSENMAEQIKAAIYGGGREAFEEYRYTAEAGKNGCYIRYFDKEYNDASKEEAYILGSVRLREEKTDCGVMYRVTIAFENAREIVSSIDISVYRGEKEEVQP